MTTRTLHPQPARGAVFLEELRAVGLGMRRELLFAALLVGAFLAFMAVVYLQMTPERQARFTILLVPEAANPAVMVALFAPLLVWRREDPDRRGYLWSLPLDRSFLHLARAGSGWAWMMAVIAVFLLLGFAMGLLLPGGTFGVYGHMQVEGLDTLMATPRDGVMIAEPGPENVYRGTVAVPAWQWLVPFVMASILYLFGSAIVIASNHPFRWAVVVWLVMIFVLSLSEAESMGEMHRVARELLFGPYGLETLAMGMVPQPVTLTNGVGATVAVERSVPDLAHWLGSVALWGVPVLAGFSLAATRHREG